jgi:FHS family L-fucose permease-like MFS transporter
MITSTTKQPIVSKKILVPFILITSLFALWGIANDLTNPMVSAFKKVMPELSNTEASLVQFAFYFGYFFMALPAALFIRKYSYKSGIIVGLSLYAIGAFLFFPAAKFETFTFFLISLWIMTCGLAFLETTANPLILALGSKETATLRLNLAQAFNPLGSLTGMVVAQVFIIDVLRSDDYSAEAYQALSSQELAVIRENDLGIISVPYIALGVLVLIIMATIIMVKFPKVEEQSKIALKETFKTLAKNKTYLMGVVAQIFYVGAQIMCWTFIFQYVDNLNTALPIDEQLTATWFNVAAMLLFLSGRWLGTLLMKTINPSKLLLIFGIGGAITTAITVFIGGHIGLYSLVGTSVFMSIMFPTIYGISLKNMGDEAKIGSAGLVMAIVGGALLPVLQGRILDIGGAGFSDAKILGYIPEINFSFILPLICLSVVAIFGFKTIKNENT